MNLTNRPRRLRNGALLRSMVRETRISADTLIYPMFVQEGEHIREEIPSMPGQYRWSLDCMAAGRHCPAGGAAYQEPVPAAVCHHRCLHVRVYVARTLRHSLRT